MLAKLDSERSLRAWRQTAESLATDIHTRLARLADENTRRILVTSHLILKAAYLVKQEQAAGFLQEVENLRLEHTRLHFLCTGPWPAYSFITPTKT
jgi:hypothetical protein